MATAKKSAKLGKRKAAAPAKKKSPARKQGKARPYRPRMASDPFGPDAARIKAAIQRITVPVLRELGFEGSFPKFRRVSPDRHSVVWFLFLRDGSHVGTGLAVVAPRKGSTLNDDYRRALALNSERTMVHAKTKYSPGLKWFNIDEPKLGAKRHEEIAKLLAELIRTQGDAWLLSPGRRKR